MASTTEAVAGPRLRVHVEGGTATAIHLTNLALTLATGGLYYFWGKARAQGYLFGQIEFEGDRLAFLASGPEFFRGWATAFAFFAAFVALQFMIGLNDATELQLWSTVFFYVVLLLVSPLASVGIRRFRYARTTWRGVRFSFRGTTRGYAAVFIPNALLTAVTLGVWYPLYAARTTAYLTNHTYFGDEPFRYDGTGKELMQDCVASLVKGALTLGFSWTWFQARKANYDWAHTSFRGVRFESRLTGAGLTGLWATTTLAFIATLGLAWPWLRLRNLAYAASHLAIVGEVDWSTIGGSGDGAGAGGEQLGELMGGSYFDVGFG